MSEVFLMGLSDRDYMRKKGADSRQENVHYNPKPFRKNRVQKRPVIKSGVAGKKMFMSVLAWIIVAVGLMAIFNRYAPSRRPALPTTAIAPLKGPFDSCEPLPPSGSHLVIDPAVMRRTDVLYSGLEIRNLHSYPVVIVLTNAGGEARYQSVSLASGANVQVGVPVGRYGLQVLTGANWCNLDSGFSDGAKVRINGGVSIQAGATTNMQLRSTGTRPAQFSVVYQTTGPMGAARP
jgi:hypothetical protein